jgi:hypothetical protein
MGKLSLLQKVNLQQLSSLIIRHRKLSLPSQAGNVTIILSNPWQRENSPLSKKENCNNYPA